MGKYSGRTFVREQIYFTGDYADGAIFPVFQAPGKRRKRCRPTSEIQAKLNQKNAEKAFVRKVHANFGKGDLALTLTFRTGEEPESERDAARIFRNYISRLRRVYKKMGLELKYLYAIEYSAKGRCHVHAIISGGVEREVIEDTWGLGYANTKRLQFDEATGLEGLAKYTVKDRHFYKRWSGSRNLVKPEPAEIDGDMSLEELRELAEKVEDGVAFEWFGDKYPEFELTEARYEPNPINGGIYIRFSMRRRR